MLGRLRVVLLGDASQPQTIENLGIFGFLPDGGGIVFGRILVPSLAVQRAGEGDPIEEAGGLPILELQITRPRGLSETNP